MHKLESELPQGSEAWHKFRGKGIGSSDIGTILGVNEYKNVKVLWMEKTNQKGPDDLSDNFFIKRGNELEPIARDLYNAKTESMFIPATFIHEEYDFMRFSADGVDFDKNEIIEIKSMMKKNHEKTVKENKPSPSYFYQCMWGLMITKTKVCNFIAYNPEYPDPMHIIHLHPDENIFKEMKNKAHWFWHCVNNMKDPVDYTFEKFSSDNPGLICT